MLSFFNQVRDLARNEDGVVSFEYVIVASCVIGAVVAAFGTGGGGAIASALTGGLTAMTAAFTAGV
jgi:pilus assembly protein Flp/PilA